MAVSMSQAQAQAQTQAQAQAQAQAQTQAQTQAHFGFQAEVTGQGDPIIFIPGLISGGDVWDETIAYFSDQYECHVLTLPGYAGIPAQEEAPYLESWKKDIVRYIQDRKMESVTLAGHSLGGFLSLWIASGNIPELNQIIVLDALPFLAAAFNPDDEPGLSDEDALQYMNSFSGYEQEQIQSMRMMVARGMTNDSTRWEQLTKWAMASDLKTEAYSATEMMGMDLRESISNISVPVLVIGAYQENPQFPEYTLDNMRQTYMAQYQTVPNLRFEVAEGAKHFIMFDKPDQMHRMMYDFLQEAHVTE
ncbi:MAG: alpha/beta fold hydrolase [Cyclonatronaceae bacterium]